MKVSKINHTKVGVGKTSENPKVQGILYQVPGGGIDIQKQIGTAAASGQRLYNLFVPIAEGTEPQDPSENDKNCSPEQIERYKTKLSNYNKRKQYVDVVPDVNKSVSSLIFEKRDNKRVMCSINSILGRLPSQRGLHIKNLKDFLSLALRKNLQSDMEGAACFLRCFGTNISEKDKQVITRFLQLVGKDFRQAERNAEGIKYSLERQNLICQPQEEHFALSNVADGKKGTSRKASEKAGLESFMNSYAVLDKEERMASLRKLRRLLDCYFGTPCVYTNGMEVSVPGNVDQSNEYNVWEKHDEAKEVEGSFVVIPTILESFADGAAVDVCKAKEAMQQLMNNIRTRNMNCYRYTVACTEQYPELFFEEQATNLFWIHHFESAVERITAQRLKESLFKLKTAYLSEKVWKDAINLLSTKYIALGKMVFHFGMNDIFSNQSEISLGVIDEATRGGVSSFDYELIKARETLQREVAVNVSFAANNLSRAVLENPESDRDSDFLLLKKEQLEARMKYHSDADNLAMILQFFGGKSAWKSDMFQKAYGENYALSLLCDLQTIVYDLRNESFHFTSKNIGKSSWNTGFIAEMFEKETKECVSLERKKFFSNNLPMFYAEDDLRRAAELIYASITQRASQVPAFNSVLSRREFPNFLTSRLQFKSPSAVTSDDLLKWQNACYYLLKEAYYGTFLRDQKAALSLFIEALNELKQTETVNERAVDDFKTRCEYLQKQVNSLSDLCQYIMTEQNFQNNQKRKVSHAYTSIMEKEIYKHYKLFLNKTIALAFAKYIKKTNVFAFLAKPQKRQMPELESFMVGWNSRIYDKLVASVKGNSDLQKWYVLGRLLNARSLNLLLGTMRSYIQFVKDVKKRAKSVKVLLIKKEDENVARINAAIDVLSVCVKLSGQFSNVLTDYFKDAEDYAAYLSSYLKLEGCDSLSVSNTAKLDAFCNVGKSGESIGIYMDGKNPILNRNVVMSKLYGPTQLLERLVDRIDHNEIEKLYTLQNGIAKYRADGVCVSKQDQTSLLAYQRIKNRIEMRDLVEYGELVNELLGQMTNWAFLRERDLLYFQLGFHYSALRNNSQKPDGYQRIEGRKQTINNAILYQIVGLYVFGCSIYSYDKDGMVKEREKKGALSTGSKISMFCDSAVGKQIYDAGLELFETVSEHEDIIDLRNYIDHFRYYLEEERSLLDLYSEIFDRFFTYDMKYQKNVVNMLSNILLRHCVVMECRLGTGKKIANEKEKARADIQIRGLKSDRYTYSLDAGQKLTTDARDEHFLNMVARILYNTKDVPQTLRIKNCEDKVADSKNDKQAKAGNRSNSPKAGSKQSDKKGKNGGESETFGTSMAGLLQKFKVPEE